MKHGMIAAALAALTTSAAFGQIDIQLRARQLPGWDVRAREGRCSIRVWVDHRAELRMRGDRISVRTIEGSRSRDEGSECSQPLPYNAVSGFQIRQTAGRSQVSLAQEPGRMNNYTGMILIDDEQGGGDTYAFEVSWRADSNANTSPAPFFDDVRACQDTVRQRFQSQNGRGSYIDFDSFAERAGSGQDGRNGRQIRGQNSGQERIEGRGNARRSNEARNLTYTCVIDTRQNRVVSGTYRYSGDVLRSNERTDNRQLR